jgi:short-subunit dehydrogenase
MPGCYQAVYNGTKAFIDSYSFAVRHELKDAGVTVTCLMPGATETDFFRARGHDGYKCRHVEKGRPCRRGKDWIKAMMRRDGDVVAGWQNKLRAAIAQVTPSATLAEMHRRMAEPGGASQ